MIKFNLKNYLYFCLFEIFLIFLNIYLIRNSYFGSNFVAIFLTVARLIFISICDMKFIEGTIIFVAGRIILEFMAFYFVGVREVAGFLSVEKVAIILLSIILIDVISFIIVNCLRLLRERWNK